MILVTGASGYLGSFLSDRLEKEGHSVFRANRETLDVLDQKAVEIVFNENNIEYVIHAAVQGGRRTRPDTQEDFYRNILMFENLALHRDKFKLMINLGSGASFDRSGNIDMAVESDVLRSCPVDYYGLSKNIIAKRIYGIDENIVNLRIFNCFSENELPDRMIKANCLRHIQGEDMIIHSDREMDFFYIEDFYRVICFYLENKREKIPIDLNLCYEEKISLSGITDSIKRLTSSKNDVILLNEEKGLSYTGSPERLISIGIELNGFRKSITKVYELLQEQANE
tara:strand:+ start:405 stop:1253 length:849 start_codon:yes stop_codon:yes gene_type:complete